MLTKTAVTGIVSALLVNRDASDLTTEPVDKLLLDFGGAIGDVHHGLTRASCVRVREQYPRGTAIRNTRQVSALSIEELRLIASGVDIELLEPAWVGANLVVEGIPSFSKLPPGTRLIFDDGASLVVDMENAPCRFPGDIIDRHYPGKGSSFAGHAVGRRGITLWVERPGTLTPGARVDVHVPPVVTWSTDH